MACADRYRPSLSKRNFLGAASAPDEDLILGSPILASSALLRCLAFPWLWLNQMDPDSWKRKALLALLKPVLLFQLSLVVRAVHYIDSVGIDSAGGLKWWLLLLRHFAYHLATVFVCIPCCMHLPRHLESFDGFLQGMTDSPEEIRPSASRGEAAEADIKTDSLGIQSGFFQCGFYWGLAYK